MINRPKKDKQLSDLLKSFAAVMTFAVLVTAILPNSVAAQQDRQTFNAVEVLVNDQPLTSFDINQRLALVVAVSGGVKTQEEFEKLRTQVIESMIDEILQLQEAQEYKINIPQAQLDDYFAQRASQINMTAEQYEQALVSIRSSKATMMRQMEAEIAWSQIVNGLLGQSVAVSDEEVDATIERIKANKGKYEYRLGEIVLLVRNTAQEENVKTNAMQIVSQLRSSKEVRFPDVARNISASSTAAVGGDLGWIIESELAPEIFDAIKDLDLGQYSDPVRTAGSYKVFMLSNRRRVLSADPMDVQVSLKQIYMTTEDLTDPEKEKKFRDILPILKAEQPGCGQVEKYAERAGSTNKTEVGIVAFKQMTSDLLNGLRHLKDGEASNFIKLDDGERIMFICGRTVPEIADPDFDAIFAQIENQRLSMRARRHLRDLRREAIVDER
ncbi:peptidylprolyl isomerase [Temperatibacter marinus]|uniref:Parvulin-like PPIase n=1 Tax=Temperatibacter marinus TaxID=1456591 RepID=A0AA52EBK8_9PROT|nr:peptidylprolyl isomerase [Temperatibacter marinus]WND02342.1 peptidylprolyl isomerase [Temperatibacter marinus]